MNVGLCIAWFIFGFIVGQLVLVGIALCINDSRIERRRENEIIRKQGDNNNNQSNE